MRKKERERKQLAPKGRRRYSSVFRGKGTGRKMKTGEKDHWLLAGDVCTVLRSGVIIWMGFEAVDHMQGTEMDIGGICLKSKAP